MPQKSDTRPNYPHIALIYAAVLKHAGEEIDGSGECLFAAGFFDKHFYKKIKKKKTEVGNKPFA